jgi:solute carrier family 25 protein 16
MTHGSQDIIANWHKRSHKELIKAINTYISINTFPLPDELLEIIQAYLDKHSPVEDSESQRLQDELVNIYQKEVRDKPALYPTFMAMLRQLRPAITSSTRLIRWWEILVLPVLDHLTAERSLAFETRGILLEILVYDTDEGDVIDAMHTSAVLSERLLEMWLKSSRDALRPDPAAHFLELQIQQVLVEFGKKRPKVT